MLEGCALRPALSRIPRGGGRRPPHPEPYGEAVVKRRLPPRPAPASQPHRPASREAGPPRGRACRWAASARPAPWPQPRSRPGKLLSQKLSRWEMVLVSQLNCGDAVSPQMRNEPRSPACLSRPRGPAEGVQRGDSLGAEFLSRPARCCFGNLNYPFISNIL